MQFTLVVVLALLVSSCAASIRSVGVIFPPSVFPTLNSTYYFRQSLVPGRLAV